jgi:hypothetical protein
LQIIKCWIHHLAKPMLVSYCISVHSERQGHVSTSTVIQWRARYYNTTLPRDRYYKFTIQQFRRINTRTPMFTHSIWFSLQIITNGLWHIWWSHHHLKAKHFLELPINRWKWSHARADSTQDNAVSYLLIALSGPNWQETRLKITFKKIIPAKCRDNFTSNSTCNDKKHTHTQRGNNHRQQ